MNIIKHQRIKAFMFIFKIKKRHPVNPKLQRQKKRGKNEWKMYYLK